MASDGRILSKVKVQIAMSVGRFLKVSKQVLILLCCFLFSSHCHKFSSFFLSSSQADAFSLKQFIVANGCLLYHCQFGANSLSVLDVLLTHTSVGILDSLPREGWGGIPTNIVRSTRCSFYCCCFFSLSIMFKVCLAVKIITRDYTA